MKKFISFVLALLISLMFIPSISADNTSWSSNKDGRYLLIYNHILDDYIKVTGLTEQKSNDLFKKVLLNDSTKYKRVDNLIFKQDNLNVENKITYIEYNYEKLSCDVGDLNDTLAEYLLYMVLNYYITYAEDSDYDVWNSDAVENNFYYDTTDAIISSNTGKSQDEVSNDKSSSSGIAELTIFSIDSGVTSSGIGIYGHAWIEVKNISNSNITVGKFGNVSPGYTFVLGTWGNCDEHTGLWYSLERYKQVNGESFNGRVSLTTTLNSNELTTLNNYIVNHDTWTHLTNCSSFAVSAWNSVATTQLSAGFINTPANLKNDILSYSDYELNRSFNSSFIVYYAQGTGYPIASTEFTY